MLSEKKRGGNDSWVKAVLVHNSLPEGPARLVRIRSAMHPQDCLVAAFAAFPKQTKTRNSHSSGTERRNTASVVPASRLAVVAVAVEAKAALPLASCT